MPLLLQVSCYNTSLSYKVDAASDAQRPHSPRHRCRRCVSAALNETTTRIQFAHYAEYSGMEERTEYRLFMSDDLHIFH